MIALGEDFSHFNVGVNPFGGTGLTLSGGHKGIRLLGCRIYLLGFGGTLQITGNPQISDRRERKGLISNKSGAASMFAAPLLFVSNLLRTVCRLSCP